jgi:hypothetical protein
LHVLLELRRRRAEQARIQKWRSVGLVYAVVRQHGELAGWNSCLEKLDKPTERDAAEERVDDVERPSSSHDGVLQGFFR